MLVGLAILVPLVVLAMLVRLGRALWRARLGRDLAAILLTVACQQLPAGRSEWGEAMRTELACIDMAADRRRFAIGALRATTTARLMGRSTPRPSLILVLAGVTACIGLAAAVLVGNPDLRGYPHVPLVLAVLATALAGYTTVAAAHTVDVDATATTIRRWSVPVGAAIAMTWFIFANAWWHLHSAPLGVAVLLPMTAGAISARATGSTRAGVAMATWAGMIGGITVFLAVTIDGLASVAPHVASRASWIGEDLAISSMLLVLVPCLTIVAGAAGATIATVRPRPSRCNSTARHDR